MEPKKIELHCSDATMNIALDTLASGKQALIFVNTKRSAEKTAEDIAKKIKEIKEEHVTLSKKALAALSTPTKQCRRLADCIVKGIAFHHAGLTHAQRELIEEAFRGGSIKIISSTPTLAMGLDLPAFRAIIKDLKRYGSLGMVHIPVLEYLQMAGRAGRPTYDTHGEAICLAGTEAEKDAVIEKYIKGVPEDIYSKLAVEPVLRTYLLSLIASNFLRTKDQIMGFFEKTFWAHQFKDMRKLESSIEKMLRLLEEWEFLSSTTEDFTSADQLGNASYRATIIGKRVAELYIDPLTAYHLIKGLSGAMVMKTSPVSFLQLVSNALEMRPLLSVKAKEFEEVQDALTRNEHLLLMKEPSFYEEGYDEFLSSFKTALFFEDWINEKDEEYLLEKYGIRPGELQVKRDTADWLVYASQELAKLSSLGKVSKELMKLRLRLEYGIKEELFTLIRFRGIGRVRARRLYKNGIIDIKAMKAASITTLAQILGKATALSVKQQLDQEPEQISKGRRKGQMSVEKWE